MFSPQKHKIRLLKFQKWRKPRFDIFCHFLSFCQKLKVLQIPSFWLSWKKIVFLGASKLYRLSFELYCAFYSNLGQLLRYLVNGQKFKYWENYKIVTCLIQNCNKIPVYGKFEVRKLKIGLETSNYNNKKTHPRT